MNIQDYIESGVLEAYILGSLTPDEELLVEANIAKFPELADELRELEKTMEQYALSTATDPPPGLEDKIWTLIQAIPGQSGKSGHTTKIIDFQPSPRKKIAWKYAAVWTALVGSIAVNIFLWQQDSRQKDEQLGLNTKMDKLWSEQNQLAQALENYQKEKSMMADTGMQTIVMHTMQKGHPMAATLYWKKDRGEVYVTVDALPMPPKGMQYQLWAIQGGKPVSMGVLPNSIANTPEMQKVGMIITSSEAFAISLEKEGGSPAPTMENIYVMGKA